MQHHEVNPSLTHDYRRPAAGGLKCFRLRMNATPRTWKPISLGQLGRDCAVGVSILLIDHHHGTLVEVLGLEFWLRKHSGGHASSYQEKSDSRGFSTART